MSTLVRGERPGLTGWEQALRIGAAVLGTVSIGFAFWYVGKGVFSHAEYPFVVNSVCKDALLAALCWLVYFDVRRWAQIAVPLLVVAHILMPIVMLVTAQWGQDKGISHTWISAPSDADALRQNWFIADIFVASALLFLHWKAVRSRYNLQYLTPSAFRALMALAEVLVLSKDRDIAPAEVAGNVDQYLASFRAHEKWKIWFATVGLAYWPLFMLRPPFYVMSPQIRHRWIQSRFLDDVSDRRVLFEPIRTARQTIIRAAQQLCFIGYYGDPRAAKKVGYVPFSQRKEFPELVKHAVRHPEVKCMQPADIPGEDLNADVVIVGTGAGGATLAYELARRGRQVLLLERGAHVSPKDFTENEAQQLSNLYADGALTMTKDFRFQVAQGMCVGGSTVVNNAVCFDLPAHVLERWIDPNGLNAGLDPQRLHAKFLEVRDFLRVDDVGPPSSLNPGAARILAGLGDAAPFPFTLVEANIADCLGCGYCNIGCAYGKKLSALDWTLPNAQRDYPDAVRIVPDCRVEKVLMRGSRAYGVQARLEDGRRLTVQADTVVLSAGALASSVILQRSGLGQGRAGQGIAFNMASPVTLDFDEVLHSERGMQITHYLEPADAAHDGLAFETWFNPVASQSLFMPGWFEEHWDNMQRYKHMTCLGVVVGTGNDGSVKASRFGHGMTLDYHPSNADFVRLKEGLQMAGRIGLKAGAKRVMPATFRMLEIRSERELARIGDEIGDDSDVSVNSAHPQGGNAMSADPLKGVVDPSFRVYGTMNVHVCDASVFPSSITVNPQLTVMALAAYAADEIAGPPPPQPDASTVQVLVPGPGL